MKLHIKPIVLFIFISIAKNAITQNLDLGSWNIINLKYNANKTWSFFGEAQLRSLKFYNNFHYYEYKGGINYKIQKNVTITLAACSYQTYKAGGNFVLPKNNNEFRLWPQITLAQTIWNLKIDQRYRSELRFTSNGFRKRFRYRLGITYPFGQLKNNYKPFAINASNELFFTNKQPYFERNRLAFNLTYKPSITTTLLIGYLHQFDYNLTDEIGRDFMQLGCNIELFKKK